MRMPFYHVWFATKRRKWLLLGDVSEAAMDVMKEIAKEKDLELLECQSMVDHMHLLVRTDDTQELSRTMNLLKGGSAYRLFRKFPDIKLDAGTNSFWQHRYGSKEVPPEALPTVRNYIRTQWDRTEKYAR